MSGWRGARFRWVAGGEWLLGSRSSREGWPAGHFFVLGGTWESLPFPHALRRPLPVSLGSPQRLRYLARIAPACWQHLLSYFLINRPARRVGTGAFLLCALRGKEG